jgi:amino acid adenylation domain-containing protein
MAGRFPGASDIRTLWRNLCAGVEATVEFTAADLISSGVDPALLDRSDYVRRGAILDEADCFDAAFFGFTPREAQVMDPQHRIFLECAWAAIEDAGYNIREYKGLVGLFGGVARNTYFTHSLIYHSELLESLGSYQTMLATDKEYAVTRAAFALGLHGPCVNVQTACSTSGVAIHLACQSILNGECDMALAGGARIRVPLRAGYIHEPDGIPSPEGRCYAFDARANGALIGSGAAIILLKSLDDALRDRDSIYAVIKGSAVNNDGGGKAGFTAPSVSGQARVIEEALAVAGVSANRIGLVEAHGTGTSLGDPIEIAALTQAYRKFTNRNCFCPITSIKTNIGHLDAGAGVAGTIKCALALKHRLIPASLNYDTPNPQIDFKNSPFFVNAELREWNSSEEPRLAAVSSFGLGGTNFHAILEEAPHQQPSNLTRPVQLLLLSARSPEALDSLSNSVGSFIENSIDSINLPDIAYTLQTGRAKFNHRKAIVCHNTNQAVEMLRNASGPSITTGTATGTTPTVSFMFPGVGSQYPEMGAQLYSSESEFRLAFDECLSHLPSDLSDSLIASQYPPRSGLVDETVDIENPLLTVLSIFMTEYSLARLLLSWGIHPTGGMIGHSLGEYAAACIAGVLDIEDALKIVRLRGEIFSRLPEGRMLSIPLAAPKVQTRLRDGLSIAVVNTPESCVISGTPALIQEFTEELEKESIESRPLHTRVGLHSSMLDPFLGEFREAVSALHLLPPRIPFISNLTGGWISDEDATSPEYWTRQLRRTVLFTDGMSQLFNKDNNILLEVGPGTTLTSLARIHPERKLHQVVLPTIPHPKGKGKDYETLLTAIGQLWISGLAVDWDGYYKNEQRSRVHLPTYPFDRKRHWLDPPVLRSHTSPTGAIVNAVDSSLMTSLSHQLTPSRESSDSHFPAPEGATGLDSGDMRSRIMDQVKKILCDMSGMEPAALREDIQFLELGFDSLFLTQANMAIQREFGVRITFKQIFEETPTVGKLSDFLVKRTNTQVKSVDEKRESASTGHFTTNQEDKENDADSGGEDPRGFGPWRPIPRGASSELTTQQRLGLDDLIRWYTNRTCRSKQLAQSQRTHLADPRAVSHFRKIWKEMVYQIATERSSGSKIWDIDGNEYVDLTMGFGLNLLGHSPDFVTEAVKKQLEKGVELGVLCPLASELAQLICEFTGHDRVNFVTTGSEAVMAAIRAARTVTGRDKIAFFAGDYHGIFDEVLARSVASGGRHRSLPVAPGIPVESVGRVLILDYEDPHCLDILQSESRNLAAVIVEPVQSRRLDRQPREILQSVRAITERNGTALIFDEVITGFRLAPGGAQEWYGIQADLAAYGKTISGGFPLAAVAGKSVFMDAFDGGQWRYGDDSFPEAGVTFFGGTFVRHPAGLAAGIAVLNHLKKLGPGLQKDLNERTELFSHSVNECFERMDGGIRMTHCGSMLHLRFLDDNELMRLIFFYLRGFGVHIWDRPAFLSTAHSDEDIQFMVRMFSNSLEHMRTAGFLRDTIAATRKRNSTMITGAVNKLQLPVHNIPLYQKGGQDSTIPVEKTKSASNEVEGEIPITENQLEIWLSSQGGDAASCVFNGCHVMELHGPFQPDSMRHALQGLVMRHDALRATFAPDGSSQRFAKFIAVNPREIDLSALDDKTREDQAAEILDNETRTAFDLEHGPLLRLLVLKLEENNHRLIFTTHHIICDGWSKGILWRELSILYSASVDGIPAELPKGMQFTEYARMENEGQSFGNKAAARDYWLKKYAKPVSGLDLPVDRSRPPVKSYRAGQCFKTFGTDLITRLRQFSEQNGVTVFTSLLSAFYALLYRLSSTEDIVIGVAVAGQSSLQSRDLTGHSVSLLPIRRQISGDIQANVSIREVMHSLWEAYDYRSFGYGQIVKALNLPRDLGRFPLLSVIATHETQTRGIQFSGLDCNVMPPCRRYCNFDLELYLCDKSDSILVEIDFNADIYDNSTIERWMSHYETLLSGILDAPETPIADLPLLSREEWKRMVIEWNSNSLPLRETQCVTDLFENMASDCPDATAVTFKNQSISYRQLNQGANQLAHHLKSMGVGPESLVGICMDRSVDLIVGLLGILKAGGAYVPLDPMYPTERISFMLEDSGANVVLTQSRLKNLFLDRDVSYVCMDTDLKQITPRETSNLGSQCRRENLAYVIYTSGSTGKPKGVAIEHRSVLAFIEWAKTVFTKDEMAGVLASTSICFDLSVFEIFVTLAMGGRIVLVQSALELLEMNNPDIVTLINTVPSAIREILSFNGIPPSVKTVCLAGELLHTEVVKDIYQTTKVERVYDLYGPSEDTTYSTWTLRLPLGSPTIGRPIANTELYILDARNNPVPVGIPGEIYLGGSGLARGYYKRPELTEDKFIKNPFKNERGSRLYRTGDLARFRPDGNVELIGRADHQVKIRGFRIELGEIEIRIREHPLVLQSVVAAREDSSGERFLTAYYTSEGNVNVPREDLREWLKERLPAHMIPSFFVQLEKLPLTLNGKVDRKQLPAPGETHMDTSTSHPARSVCMNKAMIEQSLIKIWEGVLGTAIKDPFGNFFEVGGHSLASLRVVHGINEHFGTAFSPLTLFQYPTITSLVDLVYETRPGSVLNETGSFQTHPGTPRETRHPFSTIENQKDVEVLDQLRNMLGRIQKAHGTRGRFRMRESWFCAHILRPLFRFRSQFLRRIVVRLITRIEGGESFTITLRKIWAETYDVRIGDYSSGVFDLNRFRPGTTVGRYCSIAGTARTETANHPMNTLSTSGFFFNPATSFAEADIVPRIRLKIGNDVFLGHNVHVIVPTEEIGDGAVIGSGSVVAGNVPPFAVMVGYPATAVRYRFSAETIAEIMKSPWWEKDLDDLTEVREEFTCPVEGENIR